MMVEYVKMGKIMEKESTGPFVVGEDGPTDRELWAADMDDESEARFDNYLYVKSVAEAADQEIERREIKNY